MTSLNMVRNRLIDRILVTKNKDLLEAVDKLLKYTREDEFMRLSSEEIELLMMSEQDIADGKLIPETDLERSEP